MGLDQYLYKKNYIGNEYRIGEQKLGIRPGNQEDKSIVEEKIVYIVERAGYWRKANQIHKWFVDNVQNGVDDCGEYPVHKAQLKDLLKLVDTVLEDTDKAATLLPVQVGFFFGSESYDQYYFEDLKDTKKILESIVKGKGSKSCSADYYYQSSW